MILYFSGTGNSRYVAKRLGEALQDEVVSMNDYLRSGRQGAFQSETPYVFVTPTYAWRMPRVARAFLARAELSGSRDAYFVLTCGNLMVGSFYFKAHCFKRKAYLASCAFAVVKRA